MALSQIRVNTHNQGFQTLGLDTYEGVFPEQIVATANSYGADTLSFTIRRDPIFGAMDLAAFSPVEYWENGVRVWEGFIWETPVTNTAAEFGIQVQCRGWQYHLDDDQFRPYYIQTDFADWRDHRTFAASPLAIYGSLAYMNTDTNIKMGWGANTLFTGSQMGVGMSLPIPSDARIGRSGGGATGTHRINYDWVNNSGNFADFKIQGYYWTTAIESPGTPTLIWTQTLSAASATNQTQVMAVPAGVIGISIIIFYFGAAGATGGEVSVKINNSSFMVDSSYATGGNLPDLHATDMVLDALSFAPKLSNDYSRVTDTSAIFNIPAYSKTDFETPRQVIDAANSYHAYKTKIVDGKQFIFEPQDTVPTFTTQNDAGSDFTDSSANTGEALFNKVAVTGTGPDGLLVTSIKTSTQSVALSQQGLTRTATLPIDSPITQAAADAIGTAFLSQNSKSPFKGTWTISAKESVSHYNTGDEVDPATLLLFTDSLVCFRHLIDPDTGALGRNGLVASVSYSPDSNVASVEIDNTRSNFQALLSRISAVTPANLT